MAKRTKKVGPAGRFQARYGVRARTRVRNVELIQRAKHKCPSCGHQKVKRLSTSIWQCGKCKIKFAGGAYYPRTESGQNIDKMLKGEIEAPKLVVEEEKPEETKKEDKPVEEPKEEKKTEEPITNDQPESPKKEEEKPAEEPKAEKETEETSAEKQPQPTKEEEKIPKEEKSKGEKE